MILVNKVLLKLKFSKNVNNKKCAPKLIFFNEKKLRKIQIIFDIENWLWKSEIVNFRSLDLERVLIYQKFFYEKVLIFTQLSYHLMRKLLKKNLTCYLMSSLTHGFPWIPKFRMIMNFLMDQIGSCLLPHTLKYQYFYVHFWF